MTHDSLTAELQALDARKAKLVKLATLAMEAEVEAPGPWDRCASKEPDCVYDATHKGIVFVMGDKHPVAAYIAEVDPATVLAMLDDVSATLDARKSEIEQQLADLGNGLLRERATAELQTASAPQIPAAMARQSRIDRLLAESAIEHGDLCVSDAYSRDNQPPGTEPCIR